LIGESNTRVVYRPLDDCQVSDVAVRSPATSEPDGVPNPAAFASSADDPAAKPSPWPVGPPAALASDTTHKDATIATTTPSAARTGNPFSTNPDIRPPVL
jgi:hypothetical protein